MTNSWWRRPGGPLTEPRETMVLAGPLVFSLVVLVPLAAVLGGALGVGRLPAMLGGLGLVGAGYLLLSAHRGQLVAGVYVSLFVLSTFAANLPFAADSKYYAVTPGSLGPQIWLYQGPLLVLLAYLIWSGAVTSDSTNWAEVLFGAFVAWTLLSALLGAGPRTDVALYFTLLMFQAMVVFGVISRGVGQGIVSIESVVTTYLVALTGHLAFGAVQLYYQRPLGMSYLGESLSWRVVSYPPGIKSIVVPSGFTGGAYVLVALVLLTFPSLLLFVYRSKPTTQVAAMVTAISAAVFLRLTTSDAGRGAFVVLAVCLVLGTAILVWRNAPEPASVAESVRTTLGNRNTGGIRSALALFVGLVVMLYPSSESGSSAEVPTGSGLSGSAGNGSTTPGTTTPGTTTPGTTTPGTTTPGGASPDGGGSIELAIPLFDLSNLGSRLHQYVAGLDLFVRNPLFGIGGGNFRFVASKYGLPDGPNASIPLPLHNVYIMLLAETGLPGFLLFMGSVAMVGLSGVKSFFSGHKRPIHLTVLVGFVAYFAFLFFTHLLDRIIAILPFWALAGAVVGEYRRGDPHPDPSPANE